jgi:hypothetical protein
LDIPPIDRSDQSAPFPLVREASINKPYPSRTAWGVTLPRRTLGPYTTLIYRQQHFVEQEIKKSPTGESRGPIIIYIHIKLHRPRFVGWRQTRATAAAAAARKVGENSPSFYGKYLHIYSLPPGKATQQLVPKHHLQNSNRIVAWEPCLTWLAIRFASPDFPTSSTRLASPSSIYLRHFPPQPLAFSSAELQFLTIPRTSYYNLDSQHNA